MSVLVPLNTGWEGREQTDSPQHGSHPCSVRGQIHFRTALILVLSMGRYTPVLLSSLCCPPYGSQQSFHVHRLIPSSRW